jgi:phage terminase large subunit-like protein
MGKRSVTRGHKNIAWIQEYCRIPEGKFVGQPVRLRSWQKKEILKIYDNPAKTRTAILSFARKNAKTTLAGFLVLLHLVGPEAVENSQLCSTALSRDQAALLFELSAKIIRMSPDLSDVVGIRDSKKQLYCTELGTVYRALSSDASTNLGGSPVFAVHDELGQVKGPRSALFEAVETGMGAHDTPMSIIISTQAPTDADLLSILIDDALAGHDPRVTISLYTAPMEDPAFTVATLKKANPAYGDFLNAVEVKRSAQDAKRMPSREASYRNLILNQRVDGSDVFVPRTIWMENAGAPDLSFGSAKVYGGLDLSATTDLTSLELTAQIRGKWHVHSTFWLPEEGIRDRAKQDRVPYDLWRDQGYLNTTPGKTIEYEYIAFELRKIFDTYNVEKIAFDRWNWKFLRPWLIDAGFNERELDKFEPFGQGYMSMSPALRQFESMLISRNMKHGNHPVLGMCAQNAVVQTDPAGNRKLAKDKSNGRIDGMVALAMAVGVTDLESQGFVTGRLRTG